MTTAAQSTTATQLTTVPQSNTVQRLAAEHGRSQAYAYLDERTKRAIRRALLKALAMPGRQVPFASREMPVARGWGSGGLQITLSLVGDDDVVKVIDQGDDESVNATAMRELVVRTAAASETRDTRAATIVQSRHRIPDDPMRPDQILVLQVPHPEPLRRVLPDELAAQQAHADRDYTAAWVELVDDEVRFGGPRTGADYPVLVDEHTLMSPSPIPRHDLARLDDADHPILLGAGRRARVTALPPHTRVRPLVLDDRPLRVERADGPCVRCGSTTSYRVPDVAGYELAATASTGRWRCSDTATCRRLAEEGAEQC